MDYGDILMKRYKGKMLDYSEAFFAFSQEQLEEGMAKIGVTDKSLIVAGPINGLCGTNDGINKFMYSYKNEEENFKKLVKENCTPQQVYNFEFNNYECGYIWDDTEAYNATIYVFGKEIVDAQVKRRCNQ